MEQMWVIEEIMKAIQFLIMKVNGVMKWTKKMFLHIKFIDLT